MYTKDTTLSRMVGSSAHSPLPRLPLPWITEVDVYVVSSIVKLSLAHERTYTHPTSYRNPGSEESKRITGKKAEDIILEYLKAHAKELDAHNITPWCYGENQDDGKGYDISYFLSNGTEIFVEVKGTKADLKGQVYFEMSRNEYNVMKNNPDTYYIFFVNDINKGNIIQRILAKDVYGEEPIKYRVNFKSMLKDEKENITLNDSEIKKSDYKINI